MRVSTSFRNSGRPSPRWRYASSSVSSPPDRTDMHIAVLKELAEGETRVAATPETVKKFIGLGAELAIDPGAGEQASIAAADYSAAGARVGSRAAALKVSNLNPAVLGPDPTGLSGLSAGGWPDPRPQPTPR